MMDSPVPFAVKIPNGETREAIRQARTGEGLISYASVEELMAELGVGWTDPGSSSCNE